MMPKFLRATSAETGEPIALNVCLIAGVEGNANAIIKLLNGQTIKTDETARQIVGQLFGLQREQVRS